MKLFIKDMPITDHINEQTKDIHEIRVFLYSCKVKFGCHHFEEERECIQFLLWLIALYIHMCVCVLCIYICIHIS